MPIDVLDSAACARLATVLMSVLTPIAVVFPVVLWFLAGAEACRRLFFFFQAEDGIRDLTVTGVQTCALPILRGRGILGRDGHRARWAVPGPLPRAGRTHLPAGGRGSRVATRRPFDGAGGERGGDRKSTRLNSSHSQISYAVFCLKKKKKKEYN